ncbi:MAG: hemin uptake protein HemP [Candidatus Endobugula sp.]|jgi:hemin uptake protein HemP
MSTRITNTTSTSSGVTTRKVSSRELLQGDKKLVIHHAGADYVLQITRAHKLILTK